MSKMSVLLLILAWYLLYDTYRTWKRKAVDIIKEHNELKVFISSFENDVDILLEEKLISESKKIKYNKKLKYEIEEFVDYLNKDKITSLEKYWMNFINACLENVNMDILLKEKIQVLGRYINSFEMEQKSRILKDIYVLYDNYLQNLYSETNKKTQFRQKLVMIVGLLFAILLI